MTEVSVRGRVGPDTLADGAEAKVRQGKTAELIFQQLHGRLYEANYRGTLFSTAVVVGSFNNVTYTQATTTATATPILGVWNPTNSGVNLVLLQAILNVSITALQATGPGAFAWLTQLNQAAITTGAAPISRSTLQQVGSKAKDMTNVALTGMTGNLVPRWGSALGGGAITSQAFLETQAGMHTQQTPTVEQIDGSIIIPPGGVISLQCQTTPVAHTCQGALLWEEVPL